MADEQYRWLDRATAERLLSGESPEAVDPAARDQARRLAGTLRALSAPPPADGEELPGEAAALAAFRKVREEKEGRTEAAPDTAGPAGTRPSDVGLFRIDIPRGDRSGTPDGPRGPRPLRLGLAAALVVGMVGGAAVLAGTGVLSGPSGGSGADPAASASGTHRERPPISSPPKGGPTPEGEHPDGAAGTAESGTDAGGTGAPGGNDRDTGENAARSGRGWKQLAASCRAWRDGEKLNGERRHLLENAAGGSSHVGTYCEGVLSTTDPSGGSGTSGTSGAEEDAHPGNGNGGGNSNVNGGGQGNGNGNGKNKGRKGQGQSNGPDQGNGGNSPKKGDYDDSEDEDQDQGAQGDESDNGNGNGGDNGNGNDNSQ